MNARFSDAKGKLAVAIACRRPVGLATGVKEQRGQCADDERHENDDDQRVAAVVA